MGIKIELLPMCGIGFAIHFDWAVAEIVFGPFILFIGDVEALESEDD